MVYYYRYSLAFIERTGAAEVSEFNLPDSPAEHGHAPFYDVVLVGATLAYHTNSLVNLFRVV